VPAFGLLVEAAGAVANSLNQIFGTNFNAASLLFLVWLAKVLGGFTAIRAVVILLTGVFSAFGASAAAAFLPLTLTLAAIAGIFALIAVGWAKDSGTISQLLEDNKNAWIKSWNELKEKLKGSPFDVSTWDMSPILTWFDQLIAQLTPKWEKFKQSVASGVAKALAAGESARAAQAAKEAIPAFGAGGAEAETGREATTLATEVKKAGEAGKKAGTDTASAYNQATASIKATTSATQGQSGALDALLQKQRTQIDLTVEESNKLHDLLLERRKAAAPAGPPKFVGAPLGAGLPTVGFGPPAGAQAPQAPAVIEQAKTLATDAVQAFQTAAAEIERIWNSLRDSIDAVNFSDIFAGISDELVGPFLDAEEGIIAVFDAIAQEAEQMAQRITQAAQQAAQALQQLSSSGGGFGPEFSGSGFAGGGRVNGPGSWTSDSILARLSRDEFVQPAFRVHQYGMDFMEAIRRGLLSTDAVRALMGDFRGLRFGGSAFPRFAEGGAVTSGGSRTLNLILGGQTFPVSGSAKVIDSLEREAALRSIASTGIAQSFVGRR